MLRCEIKVTYLEEIDGDGLDDRTGQDRRGHEERDLESRTLRRGLRRHCGIAT